MDRNCSCAKQFLGLDGHSNPTNETSAFDYLAGFLSKFEGVITFPDA